MGSWIDQELSGCKFADKRLGDRFGVLMQQLSGGIAGRSRWRAGTGPTRRRRIGFSTTIA